MADLSGLCIGASYTPAGIRLYLAEGSRSRSVLLSVGSELAFKASEQRFCVGYRIPGARHACPDGAVAVSGPSCEACLTRSGLVPCMRCVGERCSAPLWRASCVPKPTIVYLASFGGRRGAGWMKVGVALESRAALRLSEQGARAALVVARADGLEARRLERQIELLDAGKHGRRNADGSEARRVRDRLHQQQRLAAWKEPADVVILRAELRQKLDDELRRRIASPYWLPTPVELELPELPQLGVDVRGVAAAGLSLRGKVSALYGKTLVVAADTGETVALDANALTGYRLTSLEPGELGQAQLALALG
jgi:hypothetical protein